MELIRFWELGFTDNHLTLLLATDSSTDGSTVKVLHYGKRTEVAKRVGVLYFMFCKPFGELYFFVCGGAY